MSDTGQLNPDDLPKLTQDDVAAALGASRRQVARWTAQGRLAVVRMGTAPRYTARAIREFIERSTTPADAD